jgi:hypothetical protein
MQLTGHLIGPGSSIWPSQDVQVLERPDELVEHFEEVACRAGDAVAAPQPEAVAEQVMTCKLLIVSE